MLEAAKALSTEYDMLPRGAVLCAVSGGRTPCACSTCSTPGRRRASGCAPPTTTTACGEAAAPMPPSSPTGAPAGASPAWWSGRGVRRGRTPGPGVEETGRQLRYESLRRTAAELGCDRIATAHNADDNLETLPLHLARGGLHGLAGIPPRREIVRPLLTMPRAAIEAYLEARQIPMWRTPPTPTSTTPATASAARWCRCCASSTPASLRARRRPWATCAPTTTI